MIARFSSGSRSSWRRSTGSGGAEAEASLGEAGHERLAAVRRALDHAYQTLRRRRAGQPDQGPADSDVPDPLSELDGPEPEPPNTEHAVH
jgi:hypothetical protein